MRPARIIDRTDWAPGLWSIRLDTSLEEFVPGRFVNVGLEIDGALVKRSYSLGSAPNAPPELYLVRVEGGALTPRLHDLGPGDELLVNPHAAGFFTLDEVPDARDLWMLATGTGIAPFLSMLRAGADDLRRRFERIVVVHGVRFLRDLGYRAELEALAARGTITYVPATTREPATAGVDADDVATRMGPLRGRLPHLIESGALATRVGVDLSAAHSHVMLCGNPAMIDAAATVLAARDMVKHRRRRPGHVTFEKYW
ncbi:MAG: ferredoxin--NADP reductase [Myxococcota bacterium]